jgi:hypothetical protein
MVNRLAQSQYFIKRMHGQQMYFYLVFLFIQTPVKTNKVYLYTSDPCSILSFSVSQALWFSRKQSAALCWLS